MSNTIRVSDEVLALIEKKGKFGESRAKVLDRLLIKNKSTGGTNGTKNARRSSTNGKRR